jgi:hypothetical protein
MDGSTLAAGTIQRSFAATAGVTYTLDFWVSGNQRSGSDSMDVYVGSSVLHLSNVPYTDPWKEWSLTFTAGSSGTQLVQFQHFGGDNAGMLLDDVTMTDSPGGVVPEPCTWSLMAGGLLAAGLLRRRKA